VPIQREEFLRDKSEMSFLYKWQSHRSNTENPNLPILASELSHMNKNRRTTKKDRSGLLALLLLVAVFGGIAFIVASPPASHSGIQDQGSTLAQRSQSGGSRTQTEDAFFGSIENVRFTGQTDGLVKADTNCKPVENGLTNCIAIITGADGTELHFNYTHDMSNQACLGPGDQVTITLLNNGTVKVLRR